MGHGGPKRAAELGIEVVHQDLSLVMHGDVAQNLYLNREIRSRMPGLKQIGWLDKRAMRAGARTILDQVGMGGTVSVRQRIRDLSGGQRQCVAIGRAVGWSRKIVFLDEPTAALGVRQTRHVLDLIGAAARPGHRGRLDHPQHGAGAGGLRPRRGAPARPQGGRRSRSRISMGRRSSATSPACAGRRPERCAARSGSAFTPRATPPAAGSACCVRTGCRGSVPRVRTGRSSSSMAGCPPGATASLNAAAWRS